MNAVAPIQALNRQRFEAARDSANAWRGRCLDLFTRGEAAVTETLLVLSAQDASGSSVKLPHLLGQRYDALAQAIGPSGPFYVEAGSALHALAEMRLHDTLRTHLAHGVFIVAVDQSETWHFISKVLSLRGGKESRDTYAVDERGAAVTLERLEQATSRLKSELGQLRRRFAAPAKAQVRK